MAGLPYTKDSVERGLDKHVRERHFVSWSITDNGRYTVQLNSVDQVTRELRNLREAWIFVAGLASASSVAQRADAQLAEKCADCHLFVEPNQATGNDIAPYVHLHRGDEADDAIDGSHEAKPSGMKATISTWRAFGPAAMRARFTPAEPRPPVDEEETRPMTVTAVSFEHHNNGDADDVVYTVYTVPSEDYRLDMTEPEAAAAAIRPPSHDSAPGARGVQRPAHSEGDGCAIYPSEYTVVVDGEETQVTNLTVGTVFTEYGQEWSVARVGRDGHDVHIDTERMD